MKQVYIQYICTNGITGTWLNSMSNLHVSTTHVHVQYICNYMYDIYQFLVRIICKFACTISMFVQYICNNCMCNTYVTLASKWRDSILCMMLMLHIHMHVAVGVAECCSVLRYTYTRATSLLHCRAYTGVMPHIYIRTYTLFESVCVNVYVRHDECACVTW